MRCFRPARSADRNGRPARNGQRVDGDGAPSVWTGVLAPLNDPAYFARVGVDAEAGTIVWPDGIDLAPEPLYEQAKAHPLLAA
jgi:hypothetical protein